ncbi:hypothetical protein ACFYWU_33945 [Streptomyces chrestomyceticus]|uniref:hypothetical protein n=1 Tax=Streptomyces chrestomyceticus TaxID=68185 RepID=UPI0036753E2D
MVTPALRARTWSGQTFDNPTEETLFDLLSEMNLRHRCLTVERLTTEPSGQHYMQVRLNDDWSCHLEYRDGGSEQRFQARVPGPFEMAGHDIAARVLTSWAFGVPGWKEALPWVQEQDPHGQP